MYQSKMFVYLSGTVCHISSISDYIYKYITHLTTVTRKALLCQVLSAKCVFPHSGFAQAARWFIVLTLVLQIAASQLRF